MLLVCCGAALMSGPWFIRNALVYGRPVALQYDVPVFPGGPLQALVLIDQSAVLVVMTRCPLIPHVSGSDVALLGVPDALDYYWIPQLAFFLWPPSGFVRARFPRFRASGAAAAAAGRVHAGAAP